MPKRKASEPPATAASNRSRRSARDDVLIEKEVKKPKTTSAPKEEAPSEKPSSRKNKKTQNSGGIKPTRAPANVETSSKMTPATASDSGQSYWLLKAEPETRLVNGIDVAFSIDHLRDVTEPEPWTGVRNHVAKNNMLAMKAGEQAFFYHSNCKIPGIVGIMEIVKEASVDESAFDTQHPYYDSKSSRDKPRWWNVHVEFKEKFPNMITLKDLQAFKAPGQPLQDMQLLKQSRLSVNKVSEAEWKFILGLLKEGQSEK